MNVLEAKNISKIYYQKKGGLTHQALDHLNLTVKHGEFVGVMGPSGSGKTTLLNILATIDKPTSGELFIHGENPAHLKEEKLALFRRRQLGFVFQDFNLLHTLTIKENILLPLTLEKMNVKEMETRLANIAETLGISHILDKRVYEVSGGQQQRAACARAMIHEPALLLADEPTGNLDSKSAKDVMDALKTIHREKDGTLLMVTHDPTAASFCERIVFIKDGKLFSEIHSDENRQAFFQQILNTLSVLGGNFHDSENARP